MISDKEAIMDQARESSKALGEEFPDMDKDICVVCGDVIESDDGQMNTEEHGMIHACCEPTSEEG
jgi:hypothetical protein